MLPPDAPPSGGRSRRRRRAFPRWAIALITAALLIAGVVGAALIEVPYVALSPGSVRPVAEQVLVQDAPSYQPESSIAFTTVSVGSTSLLEALVGWLDDEVDVLPERRVRGDRSEDENRRYNAQLMDSSKLTAIAVALRYLGEEVEVHTTGTIVRDILPDSPADGALELDDVVVAVDGEPIDVPEEIRDLLQVGGPGAEHILTVERPAGSGERQEVALSTVAAQDDPGRAVIGIAPEERIARFDFPVDVSIDSGRVGGPSAGLAFALAVIDVLTPGELTGGKAVAVTGTIALDGTVGPVGGGAQKAVAVRDGGYDAFLVPSAELDEVQEAVGAGVEVIAVDTLDQALQALASLGGNAGSLQPLGV